MSFQNKIIIALLALFLGGCARGEVITKTIYKDVLIPTPCINKMPNKPEFNGSAQSAKELAIYYKTCEYLLLECVKKGE